MRPPRRGNRDFDVRDMRRITRRHSSRRGGSRSLRDKEWSWFVAGAEKNCSRKSPGDRFLTISVQSPPAVTLRSADPSPRSHPRVFVGPNDRTARPQQQPWRVPRLSLRRKTPLNASSRKHRVERAAVRLGPRVSFPAPPPPPPPRRRYIGPTALAPRKPATLLPPLLLRTWAREARSQPGYPSSIT